MTPSLSNRQLSNRQQPPSPLRRPNGRLTACDACRARKVSCDHARPVCNRCRKRGQATGCIYSATAPRSRRLATSVVSSQPRSLGVISWSASADSSPGTSTPKESLEPILQQTLVAPDSGYLGFTSHCTIFEQTRNSLALYGFNSSACIEEETRQKRLQDGVVFAKLPSVVREMCLDILRSLPGQPNEQMVFRDTPREIKDWTDLAVLRIVTALQTIYAPLMESGDQGLERLAEIICNNTTQSIREDCEDADEWMNQFCNPNIRWESLGLMWAQLGRISDTIDSMRCKRLNWVDGKESPLMARHCLGHCIDLSRHFNRGTVLLVDLLRRKATLESMIEGDCSLACWSSHSIAVSTLTYLGMHDTPAPSPSTAYVPSLCSEYRRRVFTQVFNSDKFSVSFTGRPPLLSRRYCSTPAPLDLSDADLLADRATRMRAVAGLDADGWSTTGRVCSATLLRASLKTELILEELLEVALSNAPVTAEYLQSIKAREAATFASLPSSLHYRPEMLMDSNLDTTTLYVRILVQLLHLQNNFFTERLLLRHGYTDTDGELLVTAFDMVTLTLVFWTHKDRFAKMRRFFEWLLMAFAAPGGGILCLELLRPTFRGTHPRASRLSRSSIIQQLSLLIGFFDWVRPAAPNGDLCADCKTIIQRVLDHHLNATGEGGGFLDALDWGSWPNQLDFNFELLDTFDWLRTDGPPVLGT